MSRRSRAFVHLSAALALLASAATAVAGEPTPLEAASRLFEQGVKAQQRGDYAAAAQYFARADEQVPDAAALEAALKASLRADDPMLAMSLVDRSHRPSAPASVTRVAEDVQAKFAGLIGRVTVRCTTCRATVDGLALDVNVSRWVMPGDHDITIEADGRTDRRTLHVEAGSNTDVVPLVALPPSPAPPPPRTDSPRVAPSGGLLSPGWFWLGVGTTAVMFLGSIASGVDTAAQHAAFIKAPTQRGAEQGKAAQTRTNVLVGTSVALGVATAGIGLFAVRWKAPAPRVTAGLGITPQGALTVQGSF